MCLVLKHKACQGKGTGKADTDRYQVFPGQFQRAYIADGGNRDESPRHDGAAAHEDSRNLAQGLASTEGNLEALKAGANMLFADMLPDASWSYSRIRSSSFL